MFFKKVVILSDIFNNNELLSVLSNIQTGKNIDDLIVEIIEYCSKQSNSDGFLLYKATTQDILDLDYIHINSLRIKVKGISCNRFFPSINLTEAKNKKSKTPIEICALNKDIINTSNLYGEQAIDSSEFKIFDSDNNYNSVSLLSFPIFDSNQNLIGIVCFINAQDSAKKIISFTKYLQDSLISICQLIALLIERQQQAETYRQFIEGFISVLSKILYSKSPHTASHNQKVPVIAQMLALAMTSTNDGPYKNFEMSDTDWNTLSISSLLHDCGKTIVPDYILNKATKLETCTNRIHEIRNRFEILRRDAHIEYLQKRLNNVADKKTLQAEFVAKVKKLHDDFEFIGKCNQALHPLTDKDVSKIDEISSQTFTRYFSRTVGLSKKDLKNISFETAQNPETENLLQDRPEQLADIYNSGELSNIKTLKGTLNPAESTKIKEHAGNTADILSEIPFPKEYSDIIDIVKTHKNIMKTQKTSKPLDYSKNTTLGRIIAFASVFEELSSPETPYTKTKKLSEVLKILQSKKNRGNLDADIYNIFIKNKIYLEYAKEFLDASQIDEINTEDIL